MSRPARFSLKRQLLIWLLLPQLVLWLMGGALAFRVALAYAEKTIDQSLTQSVRSLARQVKPMGSGLLVDFPRAARDIIEQDPDDRVAYMVSSPPGSFLLGNTKIPGRTPDLYAADNEPVLYEVVMDGRPMRVASIDLSFGDGFTDQRMRVQVAKSLVVQQRIARELVRDVLFPLLLLGAVLAWLIGASVSGPIRGMTDRMQSLAAGELDEPIPGGESRDEIGRMARAVVERREIQPFERTADLAEVLKVANPAWEKGKNPATRAFQGLRIHVNNELGDLEAGLEAALDALEVGGRLVVISFHSLEDRIVKLFMRRLVKGESDNLPRNLPVRFEAFVPKIKIHGKAQSASEAELKANPRSRSAVMRVAEKLR